jgi:hypothetical protein
MLTDEMPHMLITKRNPVFEWSVRRMRFLARPNHMAIYSWAVLIAVHVVFDGGWLFLKLSQAWGRSRSVYSDPTFVLGGSLLMMAVVITLAADLYYITLASGAMLRRRESGQWDALRLTAMNEKDIINAEYAVAQIRGWRLLPFEVAIRTAAAVVFTLSAILPAPYLNTPFAIALYLLVAPMVAMPGIALVYVICVLEPLWRMRTVMAIGIAVATSLRNPMLVMLTALGLVFGLRLLQALLVIVAAMLVHTVLWSDSSNQLTFCIVAPTICAATLLVSRKLLIVLKDQSLQQSVRVAQQFD